MIFKKLDHFEKSYRSRSRDHRKLPAAVRAEHFQTAEENVLQLKGCSLRDLAHFTAGHSGQTRLLPALAQHHGLPFAEFDPKKVPLLDDVQAKLLNGKRKF